MRACGFCELPYRISFTDRSACATRGDACYNARLSGGARVIE